MESIQFALWMLGLLGHVSFCVALFNRLHACSLPTWLGRGLEWLGVLLVLVGVAAWLWWGQSLLLPRNDLTQFLRGSFPLAVYVLLSIQLGCVAVINWTAYQLLDRRPRQLVANHTKVIDVGRLKDERPVGSWRGRIFDRIPGNQMLQLHLHEKTLVIPELPQGLDGLTIAHLSDLHFTGDLSKSYFEVVREQTNAWNVDLIAVTGDVIDSLSCIDWIAEILGNLKSRFGSYFILGNHEQRLANVNYVRDCISAAGLTDLGSSVATICLAEQRILLAGNERPWFRPKEALALNGNDDFRILLSHSPDQIGWARRHGFNLMLAGHTHGGQICFPLLGPVVSPSNFGVKYAAGTFDEPPTLMHVTRGISSQLPIRINCPPELTKLILRCRSD